MVSGSGARTVRRVHQRDAANSAGAAWTKVPISAGNRQEAPDFDQFANSGHLSGEVGFDGLAEHNESLSKSPGGTYKDSARASRRSPSISPESNDYAQKW